jgi:hypothetical protein
MDLFLAFRCFISIVYMDPKFKNFFGAKIPSQGRPRLGKFLTDYRQYTTTS